MDVLQFGLFSTARHGQRCADPPAALPGDRDGARPIANDNHRTAGRRRPPRPPGLLFRLIPRRDREKGLT
jgi:hypothetical protein